MLQTIASFGICLHVLGQDDVAAAGGGDEDVALRGGLVHRRDLEAFHRGLQGADRIDLGDEHPGAVAPHRVGAALADVAVAADDDDLAGDHDVGRPLDAVGQRLAAAVEVVELALGDRVVDVDRRHAQLAPLVHLVEAMHAGGGLFREAADARPAAGDTSRVDHGRQVAAVVEDQVQRLAVGEEERLLDAPVELGVGLALPGVDGHAGRGDGGGGVVLGRELVATAPGDLGAQLAERLDQHGRLDGHVQAAGDAAPASGFACRISAAGPSGRAFRFRPAESLFAPTRPAKDQLPCRAISFRLATRSALQSINKESC